jgi:hypothetical protein
MPLKMRPTGLGAGIDKDRQDFTIYSGEWAIGRIYETRGDPDHLRWFWSFTVTCPMSPNGISKSPATPPNRSQKRRFSHRDCTWGHYWDTPRNLR